MIDAVPLVLTFISSPFLTMVRCHAATCENLTSFGSLDNHSPPHGIGSPQFGHRMENGRYD
jgi:hypothetical protein